MGRSTIVYQYTNTFGTNDLIPGSGAYGSWLSIPAPTVKVDLFQVTFIMLLDTQNVIVQAGYGSTPNIVHNGWFIAGNGNQPMILPVKCPAGQPIQLRAGGSSTTGIDFTVTGWALEDSDAGVSVLLSPGISPTTFFVGTAVGGTNVLLDSASVPIRKIWLNYQLQGNYTQFDLAYGPSTSAMTTFMENVLFSGLTANPEEVMGIDVDIPPGNNIYITNVQQNEAYGSLCALI